MESKGAINEKLGVVQYGILWGGVFRKPSSGLTATFDGAVARGVSTVLGKRFDDILIAAGTKLFTASKDTYVYIDQTTQVLTYIEKANGAAKPTQNDIGAKSLWVALVVTNGTDITSVTSLIGDDWIGEVQILAAASMSFESGEQGATFDFIAPTDGRLLGMLATVSKALANTDVGTLVAATGLADVFTNVTGSISMPLSTAIATRFGVVFTAGTDVVRGQHIKVTSAKTTAGGKAEMVLYWLPRP